MTNANDREFTYEIREHIGMISKGRNGWSKELNLISWNNQEPPKFDIRPWSQGHDHMGRGITLYADEMRELFSVYMNWKNRRTVEQARKEESEAASEVAENSIGDQTADGS